MEIYDWPVNTKKDTEMSLYLFFMILYTHFMKLKNLIFYSLYGSLIFVLKLFMAALPNIEPVSLLIILAAISFKKEAFTSVIVYVCLEFLVFGFGLYSICYLYIWPGLFFISRLFKKEHSALFWASFSGLFGLSFGLWCSLIQLLIGGWQLAASWILAGLLFDMIHAAGNFFIMLFLYHPLYSLFTKIKAKL